jgi:hypothetical protein
MPGLISQSGGIDRSPARARQAWEVSMLRQVEALRKDIRRRSLQELCAATGADLAGHELTLHFWGDPIRISFPELAARRLDGDSSCSTFDTAMLIFYLHRADGTAPAGEWIGFRQLPDGAFYHQAFQSYSGDRLAQAFGQDHAAFTAAMGRFYGEPIPALGSLAFAVRPLPLIRLAAVLWPGDEELPSRAAVLFDAAASHHLPTDGLALLGSGLVGRLLRPTSAG